MSTCMQEHSHSLPRRFPCWVSVTVTTTKHKRAVVGLALMARLE